MLNGLDPQTAMKRFDADARGHYLLGFVPGDADGKTHTLRVRLTDKAQAKRNADIRHRRAYLRAELPARRGQRVLSALILGLEENALDADIEVARTGATSARVRVSVPVSALTPLPGTENGEARLQVVISFRPDRGDSGTVTVREKEVTFALNRDETAAGERREIFVDVPINSSGYEFAIGVEDAGSGSASYLRRSLDAAQGG